MRQLLLAFLAFLFFGRMALTADAFRNLPPGHWATEAAARLANHGLLAQTSLAAGVPISRYAFASELSRSLPELPDRPPGGKASAADVDDLRRLLKEFSEELTLLHAPVEPARAKIAGWSERRDGLRTKVDRLLEKEQRRARVEGGEIRLAGYNRSDGAPIFNGMIKTAFRASPKLSGKLDIQANHRGDEMHEDGLRVFEGYADLAKPFAPIERVRVGRQSFFLGAGEVLYDRLTGVDLSAGYGQNHFDAFYGGDLVLQVTFPSIEGGEVGYYYIKEETVANGTRPFHVGVFARGKLGPRLDYGFEFSDYNNRVATTSNLNSRTRGFLWSGELRIGSKIGLRGAAIVQEEDFRALSIDHDLAYHSDKSSPLEDVLQAVDAFSGGAGSGKNEINGLSDYKAGLWVKPAGDRFTLSASVDDVGPHYTFFDTSRDAFRIWTGTASYATDADSTVSLRARRLDFQQENPTMWAGTLPLRRQDGTEIRAQYFRRF